MSAVLFTGKDIANMHLNHGGGDGGDGIVDGDAGVAVAPSIEDDAVGSEAHLMEAVDEFPLDVALVVADFYVKELLPKAVNHFLHGGMSIDGRLALARKVKVRSVDDFDMFHG